MTAVCLMTPALVIIQSSPVHPSLLELQKNMVVSLHMVRLGPVCLCLECSTRRQVEEPLIHFVWKTGMDTMLFPNARIFLAIAQLHPCATAISHLLLEEPSLLKILTPTCRLAIVSRFKCPRTKLMFRACRHSLFHLAG